MVRALGSHRSITIDAAVAGAFFVATLVGPLAEGIDPSEGRTFGVRLSADSSKKTRQALRRWAFAESEASAA